MVNEKVESVPVSPEGYNASAELDAVYLIYCRTF
jgi:hypothetical protein